MTGGGLDDVVEEAGDGERADAADGGSDGGEVGAGSDVAFDVADENTFFGGGAGVDDDCAGANHRTIDEAGDAGGGDYYVIICETCQVRAAVEEGNVVVGGLE